MNRMLRDYIDRYYMKLYERSKMLKAKDNLLPKELALWKHRLLEHWKNIKVMEYDFPDVTREEFVMGNTYSGKVLLDLDGLSSEEIGVEIVMTKSGEGDDSLLFRGKEEFQCTHVDGSQVEYTFKLTVDETGVFDIGFRIFPKHDHIPHRMDFPLVRWI
jgi:hypothetical protein